MGKRSRKKGSNVVSDKQAVGSITSPKKAELNRCAQELAFLTSKTYLEDKSIPATYNKVANLVSKIIILERELGAGAKFLSNSPRSKHFQELIDWVRENGGEVDGISITEFPGFGFGLKTERDFEDGGLICSIPKKVMMIVDEAHSPELSQLVKSDPMLKHMSNVALALFLLVELAKGSQSFWAPYIKTLPQSYATVLHFTTEEVALLKGSPTQESSMSQNIHIARQYSYFYDMCQKSDHLASQLLKNIFSYEMYRWAVSTVLTRQNLIPASDIPENKVPAFIPVWDMCNHTYGPITTGYNRDDDCCDCFSLRPLVEGQQVLISYGDRPNSEFFMHNSFVPDFNPMDQYRLHLGLARTDPLQSLRADLLGKLALPCGGNFYLKAGPEPVEEDLLAFIRVFSMDKVSLEHWLESGRWNDLKCMDCALDTQVETKAWTFLATRISLLLSVYLPLTTSEENSDATKLIMKQVDSEKKLLQAALEYARLKVEH